MRPLAIDLFTGLHGFAEGLIAAGFHVVGFHLYDMSALISEPKPPEHFNLVRQDVLTLHGSQFRNASLIVASPPCQFFSYTAMPWSRAKDLAAEVRADPAKLAHRLALVEACFRIQREACEAAGRYIPMVVENVRGAIPWVGRSKYHYGSYHLWGDVPALMPSPVGKSAIKAPGLGAGWVHPDDPRHTPGLDFTRLAARSEEDGRKVPGFRFDGSGRSFQTAAVEGVKNPGRSLEPGAPRFNDRISNFPADAAEGRKHHGDWFSDPTCPSRQGSMRPPARVSKEAPADGRKGAGAGAVWFDQNTSSLPSASPRRKAASAKIAKIPFTLAFWVGKVFFPAQ